MYKILFYKQNVLNSIIKYHFHTTKHLLESHYDTLKLPRDCTAKEIRNSFLKLSKQYHPDRNLDKDTHKSFVKISQAYNVLSKPETRRDYDLGLSIPNGTATGVHVRHSNPGTWYDESLWEYRDKTKDGFYESQPYYGIKGMKKMSNTFIVFLCIAVCALGVTIQVLAIWKSFTFNRNELDRKSAELAILHTSIREQALKNGDEKQLELLKKKLNYKE